MDWRPVLAKDKATGRSVRITIFERELLLAEIFSFDFLYEMYRKLDQSYEEEKEQSIKKHEKLEVF